MIDNHDPSASAADAAMLRAAAETVDDAARRLDLRVESLHYEGPRPSTSRSSWASGTGAPSAPSPGSASSPPRSAGGPLTMSDTAPMPPGGRCYGPAGAAARPAGAAQGRPAGAAARAAGAAARRPRSRPRPPRRSRPPRRPPRAAEGRRARRLGSAERPAPGAPGAAGGARRRATRRRPATSCARASPDAGHDAPPPPGGSTTVRASGRSRRPTQEPAHRDSPADVMRPGQPAAGGGDDVRADAPVPQGVLPARAQPQGEAPQAVIPQGQPQPMGAVVIPQGGSGSP